MAQIGESLENTSLEAMHPYALPSLLSEIVQTLEAVLIKKRQEKANLPSGVVYVSPGKTRTRFYLADNQVRHKKQYMHVLLEPAASMYIQHEYDEKAVAALE